MIHWMMKHSLSASEPRELERRQQLYQLVFRVQVASLLALTVLVSFSVFNFGPSVIIAYGSPCLVLLASQFVARHLVGRGRFNLGVVLSILSIIATLSFFMALWGTRDVVIFVCVWPVMISTILLAPRSGYVVAALVSFIAVTLAALELWVPETFPLNPDAVLYPPGWHQGAPLPVVVSIAIDIFVNVVVLFAVAYMSSVLSESLLERIHDARAKVATLRELTQRNVTIAARLKGASAEAESFLAQQQHSASEVSSATRQIGASLRQLLEASRELARRSGDVARNADRDLVKDGEITEGIEALQERTTRIDEVVSSIAAIGNRSDLLALNAALEGVRAGEAGRGFVIVANRMQALAESVLATLPTVTGHVSSIRGATAALMDATKKGTILTRKTAELTEQISQFTRRQEQGTEEVSSAMDDIARISQETATSTEKLMVAMGELTELASTLAVDPEGDQAESNRRGPSTEEARL